MKNIKKLFVLGAVVASLVGATSCNGQNNEATTPVETTPAETTPVATTPAASTPEETFVPVDYVAKTKLDQVVTASSNFFGDDGVALATLVRCVDGDTALFIANGKEFTARFLGVDTPESTGQIEEWGKTASLFTASKLNNANQIIVQTNGGAAQLDTTGNRYLTYVWYQPSAGDDFRLLNLELVQEGLSYGKSSTASKYATVLTQAQAQAIKQKLRLFGKDKDENFFYGDAIETTIKYILENGQDLLSKKVRFDCTIVREDGLYVYAQDYDAETDNVYSILLYKGYNLITNRLKPGYKVSICGNVQEYNGLIQIAGMIDVKGNLDSIKAYSINNPIKVTEITPTELNANVDNSTLRKLVKINNVKVERTYTTQNGGDSDGAITLTCSCAGQTVTVRTSVLRDANKDLILASYFEGKTMNVTGILEVYNDKYQVKVVSLDDVEFIG